MRRTLDQSRLGAIIQNRLPCTPQGDEKQEKKLGNNNTPRDWGDMTANAMWYAALSSGKGERTLMEIPVKTK